eukprot:Em0005g1414a
MFATFLVVVLLHCCSSLTKAQPQPGCSSVPTSTEVETLIAQNFAAGGQSQNPPTITLQSSPFGYRVVCSSSSGFRNQYRFVSIVANYNTSDANVSLPGVAIYGQFEFECVSSAWSATSSLLQLDTTSKDRTTLSAGSPAITANITTNCSYCLKQSVNSPERVSDDTNHCSACTGCSQPLCYTPDTAIPNSGTISQTCCNFYSPGGACTTTCDPPSFPDANRTCIPSVRGTPVQQLQTAGSSCGPGCIGAIIGAILGALVVAGIVAAMIVGVYYVTHGAGASTKGNTVPGTNGMTKDNPLYLDPKVVEESVT